MRRRGRGTRATGPQRGHDLETELHLGFEEAVRGVTSTVRFRPSRRAPRATARAPHRERSRSAARSAVASGSIAVNQGPFSFSQVCPNCGGRGQVIADPCPTCHGRGVEVRARAVKVRVPAGVADGQRIRVKGRGGAGAHGGEPGDLYVVVSVAPHPLFGRRGNDLTVRVPVTFAEATLGAEVTVPTLDDAGDDPGKPGTPSGTVLRVGAGASASKAGGRRLARDARRAGAADSQRRAARGRRETRAGFTDDPRGPDRRASVGGAPPGDDSGGGSTDGT